MKRETFPNIGQALLLVVALFLLEVLVGALLTDAHRALGLDRMQLDALAVLLANGLLLATLLHVKSLSYRDLVHPSGGSVLPLLVLLGPPIVATVPLLLLLATALTDLLASLLPLSAWEQQAFEQMAGSDLAAILMVCVGAPVLEEMLFRGVILRSFLAQYPEGRAIGASALIFGVAHLNIYQLCVAFPLGLFAGWLFARTRSLLPCIALHAAYNVAVTLLDASARSGPSSGFGTATWLGALLLGGAGALALVRMLGSGGSGRSRSV